MLRWFVALAVVSAAFAPNQVSAASRGDVVSDLKGHYPTELYWNSGHVESASAAAVAATLEQNLRAKYALQNNITIHSGVKSYTHTYTVGVKPFQQTIRVTHYLGWAGAKWNNPFHGQNAFNTQAIVHIHNQTNNPLFFSMSVNAGGFQEYRLNPGEFRWFSGAGNPPSFAIRFDANFVAGYQPKEYTVRPNTHNDFKLLGNGIELYQR